MKTRAIAVGVLLLLGACASNGNRTTATVEARESVSSRAFEMAAQDRNSPLNEGISAALGTASYLIETESLKIHRVCSFGDINGYCTPDSIRQRSIAVFKVVTIEERPNRVTQKMEDWARSHYFSAVMGASGDYPSLEGDVDVHWVKNAQLILSQAPNEQ